MTNKGFDINRHKRVLTEILLDVCKHLGARLAFKGGTAAMLFYGLPRMSLDLDFDLTADLDDQEMDSLKEILGKHGTIKESRNKGLTLIG